MLLTSNRRTLAVSVLIWLLLSLAAAGAGAVKPSELPERYQKWLESVALLITDEERETFLALEKDYQRDAFIERFWRIRDPYPESARNEFKDRWEARLEEAMLEFGRLDDQRSEILLLNGLPDARLQIRCGDLWPLEVWYYSRAETVKTEILLLFIQPYGSGRYRIWQPQDGFRDFFKFPDPTGFSAQELTRSCPFDQGDALIAAIRFASREGPMGFSMLVHEVTQPPEGPSEEWAAAFDSYSTDVDSEAARFEADLEVEFPGRRQNRTIAQMILSVSKEEAVKADMAGHGSYNFALVGEVLRDQALFESFQYRFNLPAEDVEGARIPLIFERYLRPGDYELILRLEDLNADAFFRLQQPLSVPLRDLEPVEPEDEETARLLAEANAAISGTGHNLEIVPPREELITGMHRIETMVTGADVDRIVFSLDGQEILTKTRPPFSVELDLGSLPRLRNLSAVAYDAAGRELARDELELNTGANRFAVNLIEPRPNKRYRRSLRAEAEVTVPQGKVIDRVELYLNETLLATLYQPPYTQPILLGRDEEMAYVRAVAYQPDGNFSEDTVFINAPDYLENLNIQFVELYITALDKDERPVGDLERSEFRALEDGKPQEAARFEKVTNLPIHATILLDVSASMEESLDMAQEAALTFFQEAIQPKDRAALVTFNDHPFLAAKFTSDLGELAGALAGLKAERGTALYDSIVFSLYYFNGIKGQRAIILLSDGQDEHSRFSFEDTLEYARRAGVAIYTIGLNLSRKQLDVRRKLAQLAEETGGRRFLVESAEELPAIYDAIQQELRSRYYLAYQSSNTADDESFRFVDVEISRPGVKAKTMRGYYP